jgi:hypothetical protein
MMQPNEQWDSSSEPVRQVALSKLNIDQYDVLRYAKLRYEQLPANIREQLKRRHERNQ